MWTHRPWHSHRFLCLGYFSAQLSNALGFLATFPDGISLPPKECIFLFLVWFWFWFVFIKLVKSSLRSLEFGFSFCCQRFFFGYPKVLLPHCVLYFVLSNGEAVQLRRDDPLCTLEECDSMVTIAIASNTWAGGSPDPKEEDAFMCTSFF